ncbi:MAG: Gfo/Idh/MocA family oxidoreductase [Spirulinaceae cyanobacterium]
MTNTSNSSDYSTQPPLKIGLVGTGYAANRRAEAFQAESRSQLVAATGHTIEQTQTFAQNYGIEGIDSWQELVQAPQIDLVVVCTVNRDHSPVIQAALEAGKHVVTEYPLALDPAEAHKLITLAQSKNKLLHVEHIELLGSLHQTMGQYLSEIGEVFYARYKTINPQRPIFNRWSYNHELFGFPLSAALSRLHRFTDLFGEVHSVSGQARYWDSSEPGYYKACLCNAHLQFKNGIIGEVVYGKGETFWHGGRTFEIYGDRGTLIFEVAKGTLIKGEQKTPIELGSRRGLFAKDTKMVLDHLYDHTPLYVTPQASYYALKVADAVRQSAETGMTQEVKGYQ